MPRHLLALSDGLLRVLYFTWSGYENPALFPGYAEKRGTPDVTFFGDEYEATVKLDALTQVASSSM